MQIGGVVVAVIVALAIAVALWHRRHSMGAWLRTRTSHLKVVLAGAAVFVLAVLLFGGMKSWNYMQHDNGFCTGCHIMERPFRRFAAGAGKHEDLKCHDCHQQSLYASTRQVVLWVAERPEKIGVHAPVPNMRCEGCHQLADGRKPWQHALYLAGHKVHFGSDSAALKNLSCAKCHGAEIHQFVPSAGACQQSGCHANQRIRLGRMANLPAIKCTTCHAFTADIPALASRDSAKHALIPTQIQCLSCHGMVGKPAGYIMDKDPHKGSCGMCHDVHKDTLPQDARARCTTCHTDLSRSAFHTGANHKRSQTQCLVCHQPHAASVDASDCVTCHTAVQKRGLFHPPLPFDTNAVIRKRIGGAAAQPPADREEEPSAGHVEFREPALAGESAPPRVPPTRAATSPLDSFPHSRHTSLPCLTCHPVNNSRRLAFDVPRGCDLCHHQTLIAGTVSATDCIRCHNPSKTSAPKPMILTVAMPNRARVARTVAFRHEIHQGASCGTCHQAPNTMPPDSILTCKACHEQHHGAGRTCTTCHNRPETPAAHSRATHVRCDACHTPARIASLVPARSFCITCHVPQENHKPGGECSTCHFLEAPAVFRARLIGGSAQ